MTKTTSGPKTMQLFSTERTPPKKRPPLRAADEYGFDLQHHIRPDGAHYYSVQDWIMGIVQTDDAQQAKDIFQKFKKRRTSAKLSLVPLPYASRNGRTYQMEFASEKTLYTLTQYIQANTGIRDEVLDFLAAAGVAVGDAEQEVQTDDAQQVDLTYQEKALIAAKLDQGYSRDDAKTFLQLVREGKVERRQWTDILKMVVRGAINYGQITNTEYRAIFKMTAKEISTLTGFKVARDGMTPTARSIITSAEIALEAALNLHRELTFEQALRITEKVCGAYGASVSQLEEVMGVSLVTGKPLLMGGRQ